MPKVAHEDDFLPEAFEAFRINVAHSLRGDIVPTVERKEYFDELRESKERLG